MKEQKQEKTNVMRMLDVAKISYQIMEYQVDEQDLSGVHVARSLGQDPERVFKTLVLKGERTPYLVCCIPVAEELDLKKTAQIAGEKKIEMIPMKELLPVTGYIRGGCSPIGMKKKFPAYIEETAVLFDTIAVSAGVRGVQILIRPEDLADYIDGRFAALVVE